MTDDECGYVLSLPAAVTLKQFVEDGREIESEIRLLNPKEAAAVSAERLASVAPDVDEDEGARAALLVRFGAWERIAVEVQPKAAIRVRIGHLEE